MRRRSARCAPLANIDVGILGQLGTPIEVHVGGINPVLANIDASPIVNVDLGAYGRIVQHPAGRSAPYDTYSTTPQMWGTHPTMYTTAEPIFTYSGPRVVGSAVCTININFSGHLERDLEVQRHPSASSSASTTGPRPTRWPTACRTTPTNVVVQYVAISYGPWLENSSQASLEVQADLYPNASGNAVIYRNGIAIPGTWHRVPRSDPDHFLYDHHVQAHRARSPAETWVELVPDTIAAATPPVGSAKRSGRMHPQGVTGLSGADFDAVSAWLRRWHSPEPRRVTTCRA